MPAIENILVVPRDRIHPLLTSPFEVANRDAAMTAALRHHTFRPRADVEDDPSFQQIIPYVLCRHGDRHLVYRRTKKQDEARLHDKVSLGFGGHINDGDLPTDGRNIIEAGMRRELDEEIGLAGITTVTFAGIISDDSTPVSRVHVGFVHRLVTDSAEFEVREPDLIEAWWAGVDELRQLQPHMESWSRIAFDNLIA